MTPRADLGPRERRTLLRLALVLICQTTTRQAVVEAHPCRGSPADLDAGSTSARDDGWRGPLNLSTVIETAYETGELLRPEQWTRDNDMRTEMGMWPVQRNTTKYRETSGMTSASPEPLRQASRGAQRRLLSNREDLATDASSQSDGKIVFPTDDGMMHQPHIFNSRSVPVCHDNTFCEDVGYYPGHLVNEAISRNDTLKYLASVDVVQNVTDVVQRIDGPEESALCISNETVIYPRSAESKRKEWLFVVNQENFKQGVRIETCSDRNAECKVIGGISLGYRTSCKQKYIYRQLAAVVNDGDIVPETFRFPSSCCCHVRFTADPLLRIGVQNVERSNQTAASMSRKRK